jgi:uncharacterized membrane protein YbaN (DUF454 family)
LRPKLDRVRRILFLIAGGFFFVLGLAGMFVPLLPTVVFWIVAAWCFGKSNPRYEARLLAHPTVGPHIRAWRERGAISRRGKLAGSAGLIASSALGLLALAPPWSLAPLAACLSAGLFIWTRPD